MRSIIPIRSKSLGRADRTQRVLAKDEDGDSCPPNDPDAKCWCYWGAIMKTYYDKVSIEDFDVISNRIIEFVNEQYQISIAFVNDGLGYEEIMKVATELGY
jgi:hypothetical protein